MSSSTSRTIIAVVIIVIMIMMNSDTTEPELTEMSVDEILNGIPGSNYQVVMVMMIMILMIMMMIMILKDGDYYVVLQYLLTSCCLIGLDRSGERLPERPRRY